MKNIKSSLFEQSGYTLLEVIVSLGIASIMFSAIVAQFGTAARLSYDQNVRLATNLQAQAILQSIGNEGL